MKKLLSPFAKGPLQLKNHVVMAPMTRSRALNNLPNELMATYYKQRAGAGLIVTEGTSPSPEGLGYPRIPGIFSDAQVEGWQAVTKAVYEGGAIGGQRPTPDSGKSGFHQSPGLENLWRRNEADVRL